MTDFFPHDGKQILMQYFKKIKTTSKKKKSVTNENAPFFPMQGNTTTGSRD